MLPRVTVPVLALQGADDEYGTLAQLSAIAQGVRGPYQELVLPQCGHSPHRDQSARALESMAAFVRKIAG